MTSLPPIHIIGAGLAGLTLARCLRKKGIQTITLEKNPSPAKHNYGITLQPLTCQTLLKVLDLDTGSLCSKVAVDAFNDGNGFVSSKDLSGPINETSVSPLQSHCGRLEAMLREGLKIEWSHVLERVLEDGNRHRLIFKDKKSVPVELLIDASGVHSRVRKALLPMSDPNVLPYVVFRGTRRIDGATFKEIYQSKFQDANIARLKKDDVLLQVWINDYQKESDAVDISYVYSRPTRENDSLHRPGRSPGESSNIGSAFFEEVSQLFELEQPFKDAFDGKKIKDDRILHWLMRTSLIPLKDLLKWSKKGVVFLGDSAHAMPILGGEGANLAIENAVILAECIAKKGVRGVDNFYEDRYSSWEDGVKVSQERLREMHLPSRSVL